MIVVIDHFDSFVETLARYIAEAGFVVQVIRQDSTPEAVLALDPQAVVLSPGPGRPETTGLTLPLLQKLPRNVPVLGICLGHQIIVQALGGSIGQFAAVVHGKSSLVTHDATGIFAGLNSPMKVARYHSLSARDVPEELTVTAMSDDVPMAVASEDLSLYGLQFHPESILTVAGQQLLQNLVNSARAFKRK